MPYASPLNALCFSFKISRIKKNGCIRRMYIDLVFPVATRPEVSARARALWIPDTPVPGFPPVGEITIFRHDVVLYCRSKVINCHDTVQKTNHTREIFVGATATCLDEVHEMQ